MRSRLEGEENDAAGAVNDDTEKDQEISEPPPPYEAEADEDGNARRIAKGKSSKYTGFLAPTKAFESQKVSRNKDSSVTEEEKKRIDDEKKEQIVFIRRKFKEQHKKILESLMQKNKEEEAKLEEARALEQAKKDKLRLRTERCGSPLQSWNSITETRAMQYLISYLSAVVVTVIPVNKLT